MAKRAVEHIRKMRGGAQSHLMRCDDDQYYVVKFQNNPQGVRILANEMLAAKLALTLGLPVSEPEVIEVSDWLVEHSPDLYIQFGSDRIPCASGLQFGSRFPCDPLRTQVFDFLPDIHLVGIQNRESFLGMLVFDKWACNCDARQSVFYREKSNSKRYVATMVDQGFCFNANEWSFPDSPVRGLYSRRLVYGDVQDLQSFQPYIDRLKHLDCGFLEDAAASIPPEWYDGDTDALCGLITILTDRRSSVADMLTECCESSPQYFPSWRGNA
jgi:hypothetical protein